MGKSKDNDKIIIINPTSSSIEKTTLSEYNYIVSIAYGSVPMNVNSSVGHHVNVPIPVKCTYNRKK